MPALLERIARTAQPAKARSGLSWNDYLSLVTNFSFNGMSYSVSPTTRPGGEFETLIHQVHQDTNVVSAAVVARALLLKQTRFAWRNNIRSSPDYRQLYGDQRLLPLEQPDPGVMSLSHMLTAAEYHVSYGGSAFFRRHDDGRLELLAPDHVDVVIDAPDGVDENVIRRRAVGRKIGYVWFPAGRENPQLAEPLKLAEVAQWSPEPDPTAWWLGRSWVLSVLSEVVVDKAASRYLREFMDKAATPNLIIKPHEMLSPEQVDEYREVFERSTAGVGNAGRTLWLGAGSEAQVVGSKIADLDLRNLTGGGETRIAMRARIPAAILGVREALAGSSLTQGNYNSARRQLADSWYAPTVVDLCKTLETIVPPAGPGEELWYDPADVLFLQEDAKDAAEIASLQASAIRALVDGGFQPDAAVRAVKDGNLAALQGGHTGLTSVQLLPPGTPTPGA